jgi:3-oxoacyl-[acyl-carrier-protein] synthase II
VVVTGLGPVSSIGIGLRAFAEALFDGRSGVRPIRQFDAARFEVRHAAEVVDFVADGYFENTAADRWGRAGGFAVAAARLAVADAGVPADLVGGEETAVCIGTTNGEPQLAEQVLAERWSGGSGPGGFGSVDSGRVGSAVAAELGSGGPVYTFGTACAAGNTALGYGIDLLRSGEARLAVCGGADAANRSTHAGFHRLGALAAANPLPFDRDRDGIVTGEGGAAVLLETLESAAARGALVYAEALGHAGNCDARHVTRPHAPTIAECIRLAHRDAGVAAADVDYVCAHGTATPANDAAEVAAVTEVFGRAAPPVSSVKAALGHTMGAASAFGVIATCLAITAGRLPPTTSLRLRDPAFGAEMDFVPSARAARVRCAQNHGFAFGGCNTVTIFRELDGSAS